MKRIKIIAFCLIVLYFSTFDAAAQNSKVVKTNLNQAEIDAIVKNFTAKEAVFREALKGYVFQRKAMIQTLGMGGQITGVYRRDSLFALAQDNTRIEKILFFPMPTLQEITITPQDLEDLGGVNPFALEPSAVSQYNFSYVGKEKIDELDLYVFDVSPKVLPNPKSSLRLFSGRIWVDDRDLQIVKSKGKAVPETKTDKYPTVETWRENVDGKYWFPSYSISDDELVFDSGESVKLKMRVYYTGYTPGKTDVKILDDEEEVKEEKPPAAPTPVPKKP